MENRRDRVDFDESQMEVRGQQEHAAGPRAVAVSM